MEEKNEKNEKNEKLKSLFENFDEVTPDSLQNLIGESIKVFEGIVSKLNSPDEEERKKALKQAEELRDTLEKQAQNALEKAGLDKSAVNKFINNPDNFSPDEWEAIQSAKKEISSYEEDLSSKGVIDKAKKSSHGHHKKPIKKKPKPKTWIQS